MGEAARRLFDEAMALSEDERELLAVELMSTLEEPVAEWEAAWAVEIERRVAEVESGAVATRSWDDVRTALQQRLASVRAR